MKTNVYIDGFNLYFGSLKGTPYKWLNLLALCQRLLPSREINRIRYFTARIMPLPHNPDTRSRQGAYLRALATIPQLTVHLGRFSMHPAYAPLFPLTNPNRPARTVQILKTEEKRSDVNLATMLLMDCIDDAFDEAVIISNDSDLLLPIEYAIGRFGKTVGVISPHPRDRFSAELLRAASWCYKEINRSVLVASQFPPVVATLRGAVTKPPSW